MNTTNGKIAAGSRRKMVRALLALMRQYDYREITVTQIAQEARLSRKTFYRRFSDKEEILALLFEGLFQECFMQIKAQEVRRYWDVVQLFFDFWEERKELLALLQKNRLLPRVLEQSYQSAMPVFEFVRSKEIADSLALPLPYMLAYSVGGMHCMLLKWVENDMSIPSSELIAKLRTGFMSEDI